MKRTLKSGSSEIENTRSLLLLKDLRELIDNARQKVAVTVNAGLSILYRQIEMFFDCPRISTLLTAQRIELVA